MSLRRGRWKGYAPNCKFELRAAATVFPAIRRIGLDWPIDYLFFHVSVPSEPRSVRRHHLPESGPSGLTFMIKITVRPAAQHATARTSLVIWPTPTNLPLFHCSSRAPDGANAMSTMPGLTYGLPLVSVPVTT